MDSMISAVVTVKDIVQTEVPEKIGYIRNAKGGAKEDYTLSTDREYNIPGYQREIRWCTDNVQILVDDLVKTPKFLGYVLMSTEDNKTYNIIDGQQRLTVILMLLDAIKKRNNDYSFKTCMFVNESFAEIKESIENGFYQTNDIKKVECKKNDILNQYDRLVELSNYINDLISNLDEGPFGDLYENLCDSDINLTIQTIRSKKDEKRACVDYFIDINNKNVRLDYIDILKAYAFKENFDIIIKKWVGIPKKIKDLSIDLNYSVEDMYLHYLLCASNEVCGYGIKGLSDDLKLSKPAVVSGIKYEKGVDVEVLINCRDFYLNMLKHIESFIDFAAVVANDKQTYGEDFAVYITPKDGAASDESKQNYFTIINGIMRSSDVVPKLLLMKYFVSVIQNENALKADYDIIYYIGVMTSFFTAGPGNSKNRNGYSAIVLKKNWQQSIINQSKNFIKSWNKKLVFDKEIKYKGTYNEWSGQYLARRVHALLYSTYYNDSASKVCFKKPAFRSFCGALDYNDEHFLINQSYGIDFSYKKKNEKYEYPDRIKSYVSHLSNYLFIKTTINGKLGNKTIKDKIRLIEEYLAKDKTVFEDQLSKIKYELVKEVFYSSTCRCPLQSDLMRCSSLDEAKGLLEDYYTNEFPQEYEQYIGKLKERISAMTMQQLNKV